jgi:hypothetical protein
MPDRFEQYSVSNLPTTVPFIMVWILGRDEISIFLTYIFREIMKDISD